MWKWLSLGVAALFTVFALVQLNDPDPVPWMIAYGLPAAYTAVSAFRPLPWAQAALWSAFALFLGLRLYFTWDGTPHPMGSPEQGLLSDEIIREALGLGLTSVWMAIMAVQNARLRKPPE